MTQYEEILDELRKIGNTLQAIMILLSDRIPRARGIDKVTGPSPIRLRRLGEPIAGQSPVE